MAELILTTYDWVPEPPRGLVRDLRIRWALEEAGLPYRVETTPFRNRDAEHLARQPFAQVPWLTDGDQTIFESGAILLHLGERSDALMPSSPQGRSEVIQWLFAALNSVEMVDALHGGTLGPKAWADPEPCDTIEALMVEQTRVDERLLAYCEGLTGETLASVVRIHRQDHVQVETGRRRRGFADSERRRER